MLAGQPATPVDKCQEKMLAAHGGAGALAMKICWSQGMDSSLPANLEKFPERKESVSVVSFVS
jgi:hypothetical protein